jgi:hypothetical protein
MSIGKIDKPPRIAVGLDGSASSLAALHWAIHQARLTGGTVDAVVASLVPVSVTGFGFASWPCPTAPTSSRSRSGPRRK